MEEGTQGGTLGFDRLVFTRPWLDGPTALAAVLSRPGRMVLVTTVSLPVVRGPVALAKSLAAGRMRRELVMVHTHGRGGNGSREDHHDRRDTVMKGQRA